MTYLSIQYRFDGLEIEIGGIERCAGYPERSILKLSLEQLRYMDVFDEKKLAERMGEYHCYHYHSEPGHEFLVSGSIPFEEPDYSRLEEDLSR